MTTAVAPSRYVGRAFDAMADEYDDVQAPYYQHWFAVIDGVLERELRPVTRDPFSVVFSMVQPLIFLGLFTPLLAGVTGASTGASLQSFVPGILVMSCLVGTSMTGSNLQMEMKSGAHERLLVSPLGRPAQLAGRALKGPTDRMLASLGHEVSAVGVAGLYAGLVDRFVLDEADASLVPAIEALGMTALVTATVMQTDADRAALARALLEAAARQSEAER